MPDLSDGANWSEVDANNNNASPNGWPEGMMPSGVNDAARADRGAMKRFWDRINPVQQISPSGLVWTFLTGNPAYPTSYIEGEIYCFKPLAQSLGGDQFQVNGLGPKPIFRHAQLGGGIVPVITHEFTNSSVQLIYSAGLNAGAGGFLLLNPFVPIRGDGSGGAATPGNLAVNGDLALSRTDQAFGYITRPNTAGFKSLALAVTGGGPLDDVNVATQTMEVTGQFTANGYKSHAGLGGAYQNNFFNIQWIGGAAHLWIDNTDVGPIVISSGGGISSGAITATSLTVSGPSTLAGMTVNGASQHNGTLTVTGTSTLGPMTVNGASQLNGNLGLTGNIQTTSNGAGNGGVSIYATAGTIRTDVSGTALYAPNGNVVCQGVTASGNTQLTTLGVSGTSSLNGAVSMNALTAGDTIINGTGRHNTGLFVTGVYPAVGGRTMVCDGGFSINSAGSTCFDTITSPPRFFQLPGQNDALLIASGGLSTNNIQPNTHNASVCGSAGKAWNAVTSFNFNNASALALKRDIGVLPASLELVRAITPKTFRWREFPDETPDEDLHWGFVAEEVRDTFAAAGLEFGGFKDGGDEAPHALAYHELTAVLWKAVQELSAKLEQLEKT